MTGSSSTLTINFSLRQNKAIERSIAFEALQRGARFLGPDPVYVGLGSLWFQDFQMAHRILGIETMVSIEGEPSVFDRADFNKPLRTVTIVPGMTNDQIPELLKREDLSHRPWVAWLDYDRELNDDRLEELRSLVAQLPDGSAVLTTFNAAGKSYSEDRDERRGLLEELFGDALEDGLPDEAFEYPRLTTTLATSLARYLQAVPVHAGREGPFIPAIRLIYRDSTYMVTVGGFLPTLEDATACEALVGTSDWCGSEDDFIETHPLTQRELLALAQLMPSESGGIDATKVEELGFKLSEFQLRFYERHYQRYPTYAEIR